MGDLGLFWLLRVSRDFSLAARGQSVAISISFSSRPIAQRCGPSESRAEGPQLDHLLHYQAATNSAWEGLRKWLPSRKPDGILAILQDVGTIERDAVMASTLRTLPRGSSRSSGAMRRSFVSLGQSDLSQLVFSCVYRLFESEMKQPTGNPGNRHPAPRHGLVPLALQNPIECKARWLPWCVVHPQ